MRGRFLRFRTVLSVFLSSLAATALTSAAPSVVHVKIANDAVLVPVIVNGEQFSFLLDTGSEQSVIDVSSAARINLKATHTIPVERNFAVQSADIAEVATIRIATRTFHRQSLAIMDLRFESGALGTSVDGILGTDLLAEFPFRLNYAQQSITIDNIKHFGYLGMLIELHPNHHQFFIPVEINSAKSDFLLDTGTNSTDLGFGVWQAVYRDWKPTIVVDGILRAGNPPARSFLVCLPSMIIGNAVIDNQVVRVQERTEAGAFASESFGGILGSDALRRFEVIFDLERQRIFLRKNPHFQPDPYRYVTVGLQFAKTEDAYAVMSVWTNSPAAAAGIREADRILAINDEKTKDMSIEEVSKRLHRKEGTSINLTIQRGSELSIVTIRTKQLLCQPEP